MEYGPLFISSYVCSSEVSFIRTKVDVANSNIAIISTPIFDWYVVICVDLRTDTKKTCIQKVIGLHDTWIFNMITNLMVNIIWGINILSFNKHKILHFDNESDIHMSFTNCEENG